VNRGGILPLHIKLFDAGQSLAFRFIQNALQLTIFNRFQNQSMLIAQELLFLMIAKTSLGGGGRVGNGFLAYTSSPDEDLGLKQFFTLARFALHVIDGVNVLYVGVESKNHEDDEMLSFRINKLIAGSLDTPDSEHLI
jgi:hypothetical protein